MNSRIKPKAVSFVIARLLAGAAAAAFTSGAAFAADSDLATAAGKFIVQPATLEALAYEWMIDGDANRTAKVEVDYRKVGDVAWSKGHPLMRLQKEAWTGNGSRYVAPNAFSGSVLNLTPGTEYEIKLTLSDPDGVTGDTVKTLRGKTKAEPMPAAGGKTYHVYPFGYKGEKKEPAFTGLLAAYFFGSANADAYNIFAPRVAPGDTILVHAGVYEDVQKNRYGGFDRSSAALGTHSNGTYYLTVDGTADKPIVIKGAGDGEVIFDGGGAPVLFDLMGGDYNYFEGITVRNAEVGFLLGRKHIAGSKGFTLKHSKIEDVAQGVHGDWAGGGDIYIADNVFNGRHDPNTLMSWTGALWDKLPGYPALISGPQGSEYAVKIYGQSIVVAYNRITNFHDAIDHATYGPPDGSPDKVVEENLPGSIDFYGNDIYNADDNCFEADGAARNIRIYRNNCFNSGQEPFSVQPGFGGPFYIYQNLAYNAIQGALKYGGGAGVLMYNNTVVGELHPRGAFSNQTFRNNLFLALGAFPEVLGIITPTPYSSSDYNGFRPNPGAAQSFYWIDKPPASIPGAPPPAPGEPAATRIDGFKTLKEFSAATGQDRHSILVDYDVFVKASGSDRSVSTKLYKPEDYDFRLKPRSKPVDAGVVIPGVTDGYTGKAPDLGAYELGKPIPHYGPRS